MFWSDLGPDVGYEAVGIVDSSLPTVAVFAKPNAKEGNSESADNSNEVSRLFAIQSTINLMKIIFFSHYFLFSKEQKSNPEKQQSDIKLEEVSQIVKNIDHRDSEKKENYKDDTKSVESKEDFGKGVIFYLQDDIVVGVVLWNIFNRIRIAKQVRSLEIFLLRY